MINIGIITFHNSYNCGSMLQAFALQKMVSSLNLEGKCEIINFSNYNQRNLYSCFPKSTSIKKFVKNIFYFFNIIEIKKSRSDYQQFIRDYLILSDIFFGSYDALKQKCDKYDKYITGSDQVRNYKCLDTDRAYFLAFTDSANKYAYAVSFGANNVFCSNEAHEYINYCKQFKMITVRENNAKKWTDNALGTDVNICLDPTLLYEKQQWESFFDLSDPILKKRYILCYTFGLNSKINKFLNDVSKKYDMPIIIIDPKEWSIKFCWRYGIHMSKKYGPINFLNLLKYASFVITTSFHGTVFSTIFKKTFWYINNNADNNSLDDRATSLLCQLNLMSRYKTIDELNKINLTECVDFGFTEERLKVLRKESVNIIKQIVDEKVL